MWRAFAVAAAAMLATAPAVAGQGWLFGQRRQDASGQVKVSGKYREGDRLRVDAHGGPFDGRAVGEAVLRRVAEMSRDKGADRFVIEKENCWQNMVAGVPGTNHCWTIAAMLRPGSPVSAGTGARRVVPVAAVLRVAE